MHVILSSGTFYIKFGCSSFQCVFRSTPFEGIILCLCNACCVSFRRWVLVSVWTDRGYSQAHLSLEEACFDFWKHQIFQCDQSFPQSHRVCDVSDILKRTFIFGKWTEWKGSKSDEWLRWLFWRGLSSCMTMPLWHALLFRCCLWISSLRSLRLDDCLKPGNKPFTWSSGQFETEVMLHNEGP